MATEGRTSNSVQIPEVISPLGTDMPIKLPGDGHPKPSLFIPSEGRTLPITKYVPAIFVFVGLFVSAIVALFSQGEVLACEDVLCSGPRLGVLSQALRPLLLLPCFLFPPSLLHHGDLPAVLLQLPYFQALPA